MATDTGEKVSAKLRVATRLENAAKSLRENQELDDLVDGKVLDAPGPEREEGSDSALRAVKLRIQSLKAENRRQDIRLRKYVAYAALAFVGGQLIASNWFFHDYLAAANTAPDANVMIAWLSASVVEVIGILLVVARSLFPVKKEGDGNGQNGSSG